MDILKIDHLTRRFGSLTAVDDLNRSVETGQILAPLGSKDAGGVSPSSSLSRAIRSIPLDHAVRVRTA